MRVLGLDIGEKRVGLAVSDPMGWSAQSYSVMQRSCEAKEFSYLKKVCEEMEVTQLVSGLPKNMDGSIGEKALEVQAYATRMAELLGLPLDFVDERLTTVSAERVLLKADLSRKKRRQVVDKIAAAYILQIWLDKKQNDFGNGMVQKYEQ